ncbi:hypothetical protein [Methylobacterium aquaticum]|uniref:Uncharacterized protein n=1 Tax=Methylobacterium aquaticum TaxID=270351 RepID=A0A0J6SQR8_9HYPH|nr:hypothetical protein [Methylobacterium aquaticum]KMO37580.1 hypothetical protein VP06_07880 [Methylobacterium aquaticum]
MTEDEITALADHITHLEGELAQAHRRIRDLEAEAADCRHREELREAAVQERVARIIEAQQRSRAAGAKILGG